MRSKKRSFCIIGLGRFGQTLAENLARTDHQVLVIDEDSEIVNAMSDIVTNAVVGDPTNEQVLRAAGVSDYDCAVVASADNINDSILITLILKEMGVKQVVSRASSAQHRRVLEYIEFSDTHSIVEVAVPDSWIGKTLSELDLRKRIGVTVLAVSDPVSGMNISPDPYKPFTENETVALLGENTAIDRITK